MDMLSFQGWEAGVEPMWWLVLGVSLLVLELLTQTFILLWLGAGALVAGVIFFGFDMDLTQQLIAYAVCSMASVVVLRPKFIRRMNKSPSDSPLVNQRTTELVGTTAVLSSAVLHGQGRAKLADGEWSVRCPTDLPAGAEVRVVSVDGNTLHVSPKE